MLTVLGQKQLQEAPVKLGVTAEFPGSNKQRGGSEKRNRSTDVALFRCMRKGEGTASPEHSVQNPGE